MANAPMQNPQTPLPQGSQQNPQPLGGLPNTSPQVQQPGNIQTMIQNLGAAKISQNPMMMQTVLGMLGPQQAAQPSLGSLMQPQLQPQIQRPPQAGMPVRRT